MGPMCSVERPQRQGLRPNSTKLVLCFGSSNIQLDVETIAMAKPFLKEIGIFKVSMHLNTLGNPESRAAYTAKLIDYLTPR